MPDTKMIKSVLNEYGMEWAVNRSLYSIKLKVMQAVPETERLYERKNNYPRQLDVFDIDVESIRIFLKEKLSEADRQKLVETADNACEGKIIGFSSIEFNYGNPIDWQLNPLTGKRCDENIKWYRIPDFDVVRGDIKVIWEISRFSHFITLARAYLLTDEKKYYEAFSNQLSDWLKKNQYGFGANFKCGQECSLRMVNALMAFAVFKKNGLIVPADVINMRQLVDRCYKKIRSNFFYAYKCIKNNHTISELMGMIVGAWCCEENGILDKAYKLLDEVVAEQFMNDGGYGQFSFNYQRLALQDLEVVMSISKSTGRQLNDRSIKRIENAAVLMYQCQDMSGDMPNYGSNDGALVFPVTSCGYRDFKPIVNTSYALCTGKQLYDNGLYQEELLWFGGNLDNYATELMERKSSYFKDAGLFTIRKSNYWAMIVANDYKSRPAHMDQLHIDLWVNGINVLCDAGTYSYASEKGQELVKNQSHNTAVVEGVSQMNKSGPFMIYGWTSRMLGNLGDEYFEGIVKSVNGYNHKRIIEAKEHSLLVIDMVDKDAFILFHTPCDVKVDGSVAVLSFDGQAISTIRCENDIIIKNSIRSLYYLKGERTTCIAVKSKANKKMKTIIEIEKN